MKFEKRSSKNLRLHSTMLSSTITSYCAKNINQIRNRIFMCKVVDPTFSWKPEHQLDVRFWDAFRPLFGRWLPVSGRFWKIGSWASFFARLKPEWERKTSNHALQNLLPRPYLMPLWGTIMKALPSVCTLYLKFAKPSSYMESIDKYDSK